MGGGTSTSSGTIAPQLQGLFSQGANNMMSMENLAPLSSYYAPYPQQTAGLNSWDAQSMGLIDPNMTPDMYSASEFQNLENAPNLAGYVPDVGYQGGQPISLSTAYGALNPVYGQTPQNLPQGNFDPSQQYYGPGWSGNSISRYGGPASQGQDTGDWNQPISSAFSGWWGDPNAPRPIGGSTTPNAPPGTGGGQPPVHNDGQNYTDVPEAAPAAPIPSGQPVPGGPSGVMTRTGGPSYAAQPQVQPQAQPQAAPAARPQRSVRDMALQAYYADKAQAANPKAVQYSPDGTPINMWGYHDPSSGVYGSTPYSLSGNTHGFVGMSGFQSDPAGFVKNMGLDVAAPTDADLQPYMSKWGSLPSARPQAAKAAGPVTSASQVGPGGASIGQYWSTDVRPSPTTIMRTPTRPPTNPGQTYTGR